MSAIVGPCPCECNADPPQFCGGCGHAGCGGRGRWVRAETFIIDLPKVRLRQMNSQPVQVWAVPDDTLPGGYRVLTFDECEARGLDGTLRSDRVEAAIDWTLDEHRETLRRLGEGA